MRLSIPAKVFSGFAAVLLTFALVAAFTVYQLHRLGVGLSLVSQTYHPITRLAAQLDASYRDGVQATDRLLHEQDLATRRGLLKLALEYHPREAREKVKAAKAVVLEARETNPGPREQAFLDLVEGLLDGVVVRYDAYQRIGGEAQATLARMEELQKSGATDPKVDADFDSEVRQLKKTEEGIGTSLKDLVSALDDRIDQRVLQAGADERQSAGLIVLFTLTAIAIGMLATLAAQRVLAPIRSLTEAVKEVGEGRFAREVVVRSDDELAILAGEFNAMARKLGDRDREIQEKTAEVLRAERLAAVGRLAAQITHEIRNPLSSLSLNAELLQERLAGGVTDSAGKAEAHALLASMIPEIERLTEITEEYLRFARHPKPAFSAVDMNDAVDELLDFMAAELAAGGVVATRELDSSEPRVRADAGQLRQALLNLIRNAREATGRNGHIRLRTRAQPDSGTATVEVEDDGPGIPADVRSRLFEPFVSTKEHGTGLGLAVVRQIIHEHGGDVVCQAVQPHGTRFVITLPLAVPRVAPARNAELVAEVGR